MADSETTDILLLTRAELTSAPALSGLSRMGGVALCQVDSVESAEAALEAAPGGPPLIVVGADMDQPIVAARRLVRISPASRTLLLSGSDDVARLAELLYFVPDLSNAQAVDLETAPDRIRAIVAAEIEGARSDHRAALLPDKLNRMLAQADAERDQQSNEARGTLWQGFFSAVLSQAPDPIFATDLDGGLLTCNDAALAMFGEGAEQHKGLLQPLQLPDSLHEALSGPLARAASGEAILHEEIHLLLSGRSEIVLSLSAAPVYDERGEIACISFIARDITEQQALEQQQKVLVRELNHRLKNALGLVHSLARRTAQRSQDLNEFLEDFSGRLQAMSAAHGLLSERWWRGARLADLARAVLEPYSRGQQIRFDLSGTELSPELASSLALVFNELATNAIKYGALSGSHGLVRVTGRERGGAGTRQLELRWQEEGGPPVSAPGGSGFGTRLVSQLITYQHQGEATVEWAETGLDYYLRVPLERREAS